ncbi:DNA segregation ATPase FtsK/SpoIIIE, S-DNA-T family [Gammaproteobacteria bacterium]
MAQATRKKSYRLRNSLSLHRGLRQIALWACLGASLCLVLALFSYNPSDPGWLQTARTGRYFNLGGWLGAYFSDIAFHFLGYVGFLIPMLVFRAGWSVRLGTTTPRTFHPANLAFGILGLFLLFIGSTGIATLQLARPWWCSAPVYLGVQSCGAGGVIGEVVGVPLAWKLGYGEANLFLAGLIFSGLTLFAGVSWVQFAEWVGNKIFLVFQIVKFLVFWSVVRIRETRASLPAHTPPVAPTAPTAQDEPVPATEEVVLVAPLDLALQASTIPQTPPVETNPLAEIPSVEQNPSTLMPREQRKEPPRTTHRSSDSEKNLLSLGLLEGNSLERSPAPESLERLARLVEACLTDCNVEARVVEVRPGPVVTYFELQPAPGVLGTQISQVSKKLARSLAVPSIRIVEGNLNLSGVALEVPNERRELPRIGEILRAQEYEHSSNTLPLVLGKDIEGKAIILDLHRFPHLLAVGTSEAGKFVSFQAMLLGLVYKLPPSELGLFLIDLGKKGLSAYQGIPHLLAPVTSDMKEVTSIFGWCAAEMDRRYKILAAIGVQNLMTLNRRLSDALLDEFPIPDPLHSQDSEPIPMTPLPYIVLFIEEFAEWLQSVGNPAEAWVARLIRRAKAVGFPLILGSQKTTDEVILKCAGISTKIAFQLPSADASKTILGHPGAECLLGQGDMLFLDPSLRVPKRIHAPLVSNSEAVQVVEALKVHSRPEYVDLRIIPEIPLSEEDQGEEFQDFSILLSEAKKIVLETRRPSVSGIQRRLKIEYELATLLMERLEQNGVVSPLKPNGTREVLVSASFASQAIP